MRWTGKEMERVYLERNGVYLEVIGMYRKQIECICGIGNGNDVYWT